MARKKKYSEDVHKYGKDSEDVLCNIVYDQYTIASRNQSADDTEFESIIDMLECKRTEKDYEWMSDVFIPEYPSIHLTEASGWANQYFQTREFVDVYLEEGERGKIKAEAAKRLINNMLNIRDIYHYQKYMRARGINSTRGCCYAVCYWDRQMKPVQVGTRKVTEQTGEDEMGMPVYSERQEPVMKDMPIIDRFNYDIIDPRNVFTDDKYCYSVQEKEWVTIRSEVSYEDLKAREETHGYINLENLKDFGRKEEKTETATKTRKKDEQPARPQVRLFDVLERLGKIWGVVTERDDDGFPLAADPGYNDDGSTKPDAEWIEAIVAVALAGGKRILIRHQPTPFRDAIGRPYRPVIRGLCYIHPVSDKGMSDGKYSRELQIALNDTINLSNDRVKMATFPTIKVRRLAAEDNDTLYFEPEHPIVVENPDDVTEFKIADNIQGALQQFSVFKSTMQQVNSIYPTTMGDVAGIKASTTATAVAGADSRTNLRANYKSLTFEHTFLVDLYWMILQMTYQFMHPMTAMKIMGKYARAFDPTPDFTYQPVTSNIEVEYNKDKKVQRYDQLIGRIANIPNPAIIPLVAFMIGEIVKLQGEEYSTINKLIENLMNTPNQEEGKQENGNAPTDARPMPVSNQNQQPMSMQEQSVRGV
jgi:hypothetical protein